MSHSASARERMRAKALPSSPSFEDILVYVDESPAAANALAYGEALMNDGNTTALMFGFMPGYPVSYYAEVPTDAWLVVQDHARARAAEIESRLKAQFTKAGSRAELRRCDILNAEAVDTIALQARYSDVTAIGWTRSENAGLQKEMFEAVLFHSGRPVLLVPETFNRHGAPRRVLIAWNPSRESARAVHDALPLLKSAEKAHVVVIDTGGAGYEANPGDDMARHLARHDVEVEVNHVPASGESIHHVLLRQAQYLGADMIVMGGYGHSRTGEWLFGGVTRDILGATEVPLLMSH